MEEIKWILTAIYLIWNALCDWRSCKVPVLGLVLGGAGAIGVVLIDIVTSQRTIMEILLGVLPGVFVLMLAWCTRKIGYADGIILLILGVLYGYAKTVFFLSMSILLLAGISIVLLCVRKASRNTTVPYIPSLAIIFILHGILVYCT